MSSNTTQSLPQLQQDKTRGGNYFVANYPPFSFWSADGRYHVDEALQQRPIDDTVLGLYVHIPFCRKRCHFCYFKVYTDRNAQQIRDYMKAVVDELRMFIDRPLIAGRVPRFVYFGGGTPSYLSAEQLTYLTDQLKAALPWDQAQEIAFECEPGTLTEKKLRAIRDFGVTRLSLGIEHFDEQILQANNRAHLSAEIYRAYETAREIGFPQINIDLIAGMLGETDEKWYDAVSQAIMLQPDSITIYQMEIPFNTTVYQWMKEQGLDGAPVADWQTKRRWVADAFARLEREGYTIGSAYTAVRDPGIAFLYRDELWRGADMLGIGVSSFSHLHGVHYQNEHHIDPYIEQVQRGEMPIRRAMCINDEEAMIRQFVLQMKLGRVETAPFKQRFGVDLTHRFSDRLREYRDKGWLNFDDVAIELSRDGLLQVDSLLHGFFLPRHRDSEST